MPGLLPWKRVDLASREAPEVLQQRLADATIEWERGGWGRAVPPPPWSGDAFLAVELTWGRAVVVEGTIRADAPGSRLVALVRPHGAYLLVLALVLVASLHLASREGSWAPLLLALLALPLVLLRMGRGAERVARELLSAMGRGGGAT